MKTLKYYFLITFLSIGLCSPLNVFATSQAPLFSEYEIILVCKNESCYNTYSASFAKLGNKVYSYKEVNISDAIFLESITKESFLKYGLSMSDGVYLYVTKNCSKESSISCNFPKEQKSYKYYYNDSSLKKISDGISDADIEAAISSVKENGLNRAKIGEKEIQDENNKRIVIQKAGYALNIVTILVYFMVAPMLFLSFSLIILNVIFSVIKKYTTLTEQWNNRSDLLLNYKRRFYLIFSICLFVVIIWFACSLVLAIGVIN